ncbi:hypothetical protein THAOC_01620 [Thalassiosira oceanica]|uniref:Uncharacterized protein n=1 Tax=Thalassiosira oceanica TaxID=159749 RepID=K0TMX4_THAOC|nr:hypothetical protein THAOC_01620 [Thalassiosira oceanica]|eukprot:EJK76606.1 hypothetical protein THAOC_01620 [Thalassiosira oceanica]
MHSPGSDDCVILAWAQDGGLASARSVCRKSESIFIRRRSDVGGGRNSSRTWGGEQQAAPCDSLVNNEGLVIFMMSSLSGTSRTPRPLWRLAAPAAAQPVRRERADDVEILTDTACRHYSALS